MADHPIKNAIVSAMKEAMKAREQDRLNTIRLILSEFKRIEVDERIDVEDERALSLLDKMVKQRRESIKQFVAGNRPELAAKEQAEIEVIQDFMPQQLSDEETTAIIKAAIASSGAISVRDMGAVMNLIRPQLQGRCDLGEASKLVKNLLGP